MKNRRWLALGLAAAFLFQASDLTRVVFAKYRLAPTCPVVGFDNSQDIGTDTVDTCCSKRTPQDDKQSVPAPQPRKTSNDCNLCKLLMMADTAMSVELPARVVEIVSENLGRQYSSDRHVSLHTFDPFHGRAPPAVG